MGARYGYKVNSEARTVTAGEKRQPVVICTDKEGWFRCMGSWSRRSSVAPAAAGSVIAG